MLSRWRRLTCAPGRRILGWPGRSVSCAPLPSCEADDFRGLAPRPVSGPADHALCTARAAVRWPRCCRRGRFEQRADEGCDEELGLAVSDEGSVSSARPRLTARWSEPNRRSLLPLAGSRKTLRRARRVRSSGVRVRRTSLSLSDSRNLDWVSAEGSPARSSKSRGFPAAEAINCGLVAARLRELCAGFLAELGGVHCGAAPEEMTSGKAVSLQ